MSYKVKKSYAQGLTSRSIILPRTFLKKYEITDKVKITLKKGYILITKAHGSDFFQMGIEFKSVIDEKGNYYRGLTTLTSGCQSVTIPKLMLSKLYIKDDDYIKISSLSEEGIQLSKAKKEDLFNE